MNNVYTINHYQYFGKSTITKIREKEQWNIRYEIDNIIISQFHTLIRYNILIKKLIIDKLLIL